ncbi:Valine--tRNA ligase [Desulfovibrionales bacterium]
MAAYELSKVYEPKDVEARWSAFWEAQGTFIADPDAPGEPYAIVMPPPNVTGSLHMGHALNITLQDVLCRHHRQLGRKVLWVPGMDHAGIATQNVVERTLKVEGKSRHDMGREAFVDRVWQWKKEYGGRILNQIRRLGASVDCSRERFTFDEGLSRAVREVFVRLYEEGLIYKSDYIINWCGRCHTALAEDEVEYTLRNDTLYYIKYPLEIPLAGLDGLVIATTRPETMLGDVAVAVHPEDERYLDAIGCYVILPLIGRRLPIIADRYVEKEFGTGCLKITPAHDINDWNLGRTHDLDVIQVIDDQGCIVAGERWQGMTKEACRKAVIEELEVAELLVKFEDYSHKVGECYRCKTIIEPQVSLQWFVAVKTLTEKARAAVPVDTVIYPKSWSNTYFHWLDNAHDWCISRQIWWGHRIPAWTCRNCSKLIVLRDDPTVCPDCCGIIDQDEDVLDTWFSSALWPFSTLGWPDGTKDLATWYPTAVLVTAFDILFFWVARMMMMGIHFMGRVPFRDVYIHALVRDVKGQKMSKSIGNVIDPLDMIDRFGTDALRFTLTAMAAVGRDIRLSEGHIESYRHFCNKLWNAARFAIMRLPEEMPLSESKLIDYPVHQVSGIHHAWLFHRLEELKEKVRDGVASYHFNDVAQSLYRFIWHELCDWYLEMLKSELAGKNDVVREAAQICLWNVLREVLVLLHPIVPFITQEIWNALPGISEYGRNLVLVPYPAMRPERHNPMSVQDMALIQDMVVAVRTIRSELGIAPSKELDVLVRTVSDEDRQLLKEKIPYIRFLARVRQFDAGPEVSGSRTAATMVIRGGSQLFVPLAGAIDFNAELARLDKELVKLDKELAGVECKLAKKSFAVKAPAELVKKERARAVELVDKRGKLEILQDRLREVIG